MRDAVRPSSVLLLVGALVATLLSQQLASARPGATASSDGFAPVVVGEASTGTFVLELEDGDGIGDGQRLGVALRLSTDGEPVVGQDLTVVLGVPSRDGGEPGGFGAPTNVTTDDDGVVALQSGFTAEGGGLAVDVTATLPVGRHTLEAQLLDGEDHVTRIAGGDRYATAVAASRSAFRATGGTVYVATGVDFIDALSGGAAAARDEAPLLLVGENVPASTAAEVRRLAPDRIVVLGGPQAISEATAAELEGLGTAEVVRRAGTDRFATAVDVSRSTWTAGADTVVLANARTFPDAVTGGGLAARLDAPVLLFERDSLPEATAAELRRLDPDRILVMGGEAVASPALVDAVTALGLGRVERVAGPDRYATSIAALDVEPRDGPPVLYVATGENFPDALAGIPVAARVGGDLLLSPTVALRQDGNDLILRKRPGRAALLGGQTALSNVAEFGVRRAVDLFGDHEPRHLGDPVATTVLVVAEGEEPTDTEAPTDSETPTGSETPTETEAPTPIVDLTDPTTDDVTTITVAESFDVTFTTDLAGDWEVFAQRTTTTNRESLGTGTANDGSNTVTVSGPLVEGAYDVIIEVTSDGETGSDNEDAALVVEEPPTPVVDITDPTSDDVTTITTGASTSVTFTSTEAGEYTITLARNGGDITPFANGTVAADTPLTVTFDGPSTEGTYDVIVSVVTPEEKTGSDTEDDALVVTLPLGVPTVDITAPTGGSPAFVGAGQPFDITFDVDLAGAGPGTYDVLWAPSGSIDYSSFAGAGGIATVDGTITRTVTAPGAPGAQTPGYDIRVTLSNLGGSAEDVEEAAFFTAPAALPGPSTACRLGGEAEATPVLTGNGGDPMDPRHCLLPFPSNFHTRSVNTALEGDNDLRINFVPTAMPRNRSGKLVDPTEWNRNDGFSPGSMVMTVVPDLDLAQTWNPGDPDSFADLVTTPARSLDPDAPILLVDADTGQRHPYWAELDTHPQTLEGGWAQTLIIRPLVHFTEGHRYLVGLRNMRDASGAAIDAGDVFTYYRDDDATNPFPGDVAFEARRGQVQQILTDLETHTNLDRTTDNVFLAWDFTVASEVIMAGRLLTIRDDAFTNDLGDANLADGIIPEDSTSPPLTITSVTEESGRKLRTVVGELTIPLYLREPQQTDLTIPDFPGCGDLPDPLDFICGQEQAVPGARFYYANPGDEFPTQNPVQETMTAEFVCTIAATSLVEGVVDPSRVALYGHGLLGGKGESTGSSAERMTIDQNQTHCALDWFGFASEDIGNVADTLTDYSSFPSIVDRVQQGFFNWQYLARAVVHPDGLQDAQAPDGTYPFRADGTADGDLLIDTSRVVYEGNSQGGILGGGLLSIAPDVRRGVFGVPGTNYSTLLNRSVDWEGNNLVDFSEESPFPQPVPNGLGYASFYYASYPDKVDQQVGFGLLQMLWDRAEGNGYAQHTTTDPYPNTPTHQVLLHPAWGDYQVTTIAAEVQARTYDAAFLEHSLEPGLHWANDPAFAFTRLEDAPDHHSAIVYWDSGNPVPPNGNLPPLKVGQDPHSDPRKDPNSAIQRAAFFDTGTIPDVLPGAPYYSYRYPERACGADERGICPS